MSKNDTAPRQSIYEYICAHVKDGVLPENFELPQEKKNDMTFAPGARDGIYIFHIPPAKITEDDQASVKDMIDNASAGNYEKAERIGIRLGETTHALPLMSEMQQYVADHIDDLDDENLFKFACWLLETSADIECVKFGFGLSDLFECQDPGFRDTIRTLGLSDEFTVYAAISMMMWLGGNEELFELAKKVHGWGRIHAVDRLAPESDEITDWLFYEGARNNVLPGYSAFSVFVKSNAAERFKKEMDRRTFDAASVLVEALIPDEPIPGLSSLANAGEILGDYLARAAEQELTDDDLGLIEEVRMFAKSKDHPLPEVEKKCAELLES